jgi:hypothetical protein
VKHGASLRDNGLGVGRCTRTDQHYSQRKAITGFTR